MDTKKLYINSQKTVLNWGVAISITFFALALYALLKYFLNKSIPTAPQKPFEIWLNFFTYLVIAATSVISRINLNPKAALTTVLAYNVIYAYFLVDSALKLKATVAAVKAFTGQSNILHFILGYGVAFVILTSLNILYYRTYRAVKNIKQVNALV